jgi:hypothetical protein
VARSSAGFRSRSHEPAAHPCSCRRPLFKQPLASFTIGQLYFASLPLPAGPASIPAITLWLDSAGTNGAKVYFPTGAQVVPAPPALALLATALAGLAAVRGRKRPAA